MQNSQSKIEDVCMLWQSSWEKAKLVWNPFVRLQQPIWCISNEQAYAEDLTTSFAMIRLTDHRIVINLQEVVKLNLEKDAIGVLAHEIGHHIYTPANLYDNATLIGRIRWGLSGIENRAPMVANLYEDFLINDRLQRINNLDIASIYKRINKKQKFTEFWTLIMRTYEYLWKLNIGELATDLSFHSKKINADASLIASIIRSYSNSWIDGGGRFAVMVYPYLMEEKKYHEARKSILILLDAEQAGKDAEAISGMTKLDIDGIAGVVDLRKQAVQGNDAKDGIANQPSTMDNVKGGVGPRKGYLAPNTYIDLMRQVNPNSDSQKLINKYYKEIALPYLISFPNEKTSISSNTTPEGLDIWNIGDPMEELDYLQTSILSPQIFPGINTQKRMYGCDNESEDLKGYLNIYIGIDCSGSMRNPNINFSWPVLAATIIGLSALRAGTKAMACLSGEPGSYIETDGFIDEETTLLTTITSYLGTGYAYGVERLRKPFGITPKKKSHIVIVTDNDIFSMLNSETETQQSHWDLIEIALKNAGGIGVIVLHSPVDYGNSEVKRLIAMGWRIHYVTNEEELLSFAAEFSEQNYTF